MKRRSGRHAPGSRIDRPDEFGIDRVGIYSAGYAHLFVWDLDHYLSVLTGGPVDVAAEREKTWSLLGG